jgi:pimeloyl-ACP methyl ester carboxylesterase
VSEAYEADQSVSSKVPPTASQLYLKTKDRPHLSVMTIFNLLSAILASTLLGSLADTFPANKNIIDSEILWTDCFNASIPLECANFTVPVDWDNPNRDRFNLFITKISARNSKARLGNLFFQPGGPGDAPSGDLIPGNKLYEFWMSSKLTDVFDFIAIDPRGTGSSNPVHCNHTLFASDVSLFPETEDEYHKMVAYWSKAGQSCLDLTGPFLEYVDTISAVKDFEAVRVALGDESMNFYGLSYGAQFGSQYAEVFPDNIRAIVLDGILDHSQTSPIYSWETESQSFEATLDRFFQWCHHNATCALHNETDIAAYFDRLIESANKAPITADSNHDYGPNEISITGYDILDIVQEILVFPNGELGLPGFAGLAEALKGAVENPEENAFAQYKAGAIPEDVGNIYSYTAIICADWDFSSTNISYSQYRNRMHMARALSPHTLGTGEWWTLAAQCQNWPVQSRNLPHEISTFTFKDSSHTLKTPVLLVNAFWDPETSYAWAVNLQRQFGDDNAVLLSRNGSGHTSYFQPGAVSDAIDDYLIHLKVPERGAVLRNDGI